MRVVVVMLVGCVATAPGWATAQTATASAAVGAGVAGAQAAVTAEVSVDVTGPAYAMGLGASLRWVGTDGFDTRDWDEPSEWASVLRYLVYTRSAGDATGHTKGHTGGLDGVTATAVAGQLGDVTLGYGALIRGYTSGIDLDHRRLGTQLRIEGASYGAEGLVDDVVAPRIAGARGYWYRQAAIYAMAAGVSVAADLAAPTMAAGMETAMLPLFAIDGGLTLHTRDRRLAGGVHVELAAVSTTAAGVHLGLSLAGRVGDAQLGARGALSLGTENYIPGWIGPLYERDRRQLAAMQPQRDVAQSRDVGGLGALVEAAAKHPRLGEATVSVHHRAGLSDLVVARVAAPHAHRVQGALWAAVEIAGDGRALAIEVRAALPNHMFAGVTAARLYREHESGLVPWWQATASVGVTLDVPAVTPAASSAAAAGATGTRVGR